MMINKWILPALVLAVSTITAQAAEPLFVDGQTKLYVNEKVNKLFCTYCGFGEDATAIKGPSVYEGSSVEHYFKEQGTLIVREDQGSSCYSGRYVAINLITRVSRELALPNCKETKASYLIVKNKPVVTIKQGNKTTTFPL